MVSRILARISKRHHYEEPEESIVVVAKKKLLTIPPLIITFHHRSDCRCLCRPQKKFVISHVPDRRRVLVPTPGAKCGAREYIIAHDLPHPAPSVKPLLAPQSSKIHPATLCAIQEVPTGYTRVLVPLPETKCGERDYVVVQENGKLLQHEGSDAVLTTNNPPPADPRKNKTSRRICERRTCLLSYMNKLSSIHMIIGTGHEGIPSRVLSLCKANHLQVEFPSWCCGRVRFKTWLFYWDNC